MDVSRQPYKISGAEIVKTRPDPIQFRYHATELGWIFRKTRDWDSSVHRERSFRYFARRAKTHEKVSTTLSYKNFLLLIQWLIFFIFFFSQIVYGLLHITVRFGCAIHVNIIWNFFALFMINIYAETFLIDRLNLIIYY